MICVHPKCGRDDLPAAPGMPLDTRIPCSHVRTDGEPCSEAANMYDDEAHGVIATEQTLWDADVRPQDSWFTSEKTVEILVTDPEQIALLEQGTKPLSVGYEVAKKTRKKTPKVEPAPAAPAQDDPIKTAIEARLRELRGGASAEETPAVPAKQVAPATKKADVQSARDQGDVDDWEP